MMSPATKWDLDSVSPLKRTLPFSAFVLLMGKGAQSSQGHLHRVTEPWGLS